MDLFLDYGRGFHSNDARGAVRGTDPATLLDVRDPKSLLSRILIPRPADTDNSRKVREAILDVFRHDLGSSASASTMDWAHPGKLGWHIEQHSFLTDTPEGRKNMTNLILTKNPAAPRKLVVAALSAVAAAA